MKRAVSQRSLRISLVWLLSLASVTSFVLAGAVLLLFRLPQIEAQTHQILKADSVELAQRTELALGMVQGQVEVAAATLSIDPGFPAQTLLERLVGAQTGGTAAYLLGADGRVLAAAVSPGVGVLRARELLGNDFSGDRLFRLVRAAQHLSWSEKFLSPVNHQLAVSVGTPVGEKVLVVEVALDFLVRAVQHSTAVSTRALWIVDGRGELLADSARPERVGILSLTELPLFREALQGRQNVSGSLAFEGERFDAAMAYSDVLDWYFVLRTPSGWRNPAIRSAMEFGLIAIGLSLLLALVLAPVWATSMARPISRLSQHAQSIARGEEAGEWPHSRTRELNELAASIAGMATAVREREQELAAIFEFSQIGLMVAAGEEGEAFVKTNRAAQDLLGYSAAELATRRLCDAGVWQDEAAQHAFVDELVREGSAHAEAWLQRADGSLLLVMLHASRFMLGERQRTVLVLEDVTALRRIEAEVRQLNCELEARVAQRTAELQETNAELSDAVLRLSQTQAELVQAEKLASLGSLVAGVAHELNTPIGNGIMAVSSMRDALRLFRKHVSEGLRRSTLDEFVNTLEQGADISQRNLVRAGELVSSFKQVAVDQTSSQRRHFYLDEMVGELALTLHPMLRKSVAKLKLNLPTGLLMDSYPGPLGQVLTNLVLNALTHAFDGRLQGAISITALHDPTEAALRLAVSDDGMGIREDILPRIFDPFVTTRMGRGGTGLGLHIAHNIVVQLLGGGISARNEPQGGAVFELWIPLVAPMAATDTAQDLCVPR